MIKCPPLSSCHWCLRSVIAVKISRLTCLLWNQLPTMRMTSHLTPHNNFTSKTLTTSDILHCLLIWRLLLCHSNRCWGFVLLMYPISQEWGESAYLGWLTDADYSSASYQSQGGAGVWEKFSPTTMSTSPLTPAVSHSWHFTQTN